MRKTKSTKVLVQFIQDRSGSMTGVWSEAVNGFKQFVEDLKTKGKADNIEYLVSLTVFDTMVDQPIVACQINDVQVATIAKFPPRGMTALYDAVGLTIVNTEVNRQGAEKIVVVIATDGHENSSRDWDKAKINKAVSDKLNKGDWSFIYLGTQPETWHEAQAMGISRGSTVTYSAAATMDSYKVTSGAIHGQSVSSSRGNRNLMAHRVNRARAQAIGMTVGEEEPTVQTPTVVQPTITVEPKAEESVDKTIIRWR